MAERNALMMGEMRATPRNALMGTIADALGGVSRFANTPDKEDPSRKANALLAFLSNGLGIGDVAATADRMSYGHDLTRGTGMARQMLPETAGALMTAGPMAAKYPVAAGKLAMGAMNGGADAALGAERAATVWHGSPHKFDRFDSSKIGTGEGAQAYGHGLYLAESPEVAKGYQRDLSTKVLVDGKPLLVNNKRFGAGLGNSDVEDYLVANNGDLGAAIQNAVKDMRYVGPGEGRADMWPTLIELKNLRGRVQTTMDGSLYKVDLPDEKIARMLDWDKPLSQQAKAIQMAIGSASDGAAGQSLLNELAARGFVKNKFGESRGAVEQFLRSKDIPGIRYLDGGSRGAGAGTSNYVVFPGEENALQILERNGKALR